MMALVLLNSVIFCDTNCEKTVPGFKTCSNPIVTCVHNPQLSYNGIRYSME